MARVCPSLGINFNLHLGRGNFKTGSLFFTRAPKNFQKHFHDPPARFFQVEQETDKRRYDGLPEQRAHSRIYVGQNHKLQKAKKTVRILYRGLVGVNAVFQDISPFAVF
jgi:hypothetical protein